MIAAAPIPATISPRTRRGPRTAEGKARSAMNAVKHGLRARGFALLPEEDPAEWALHLADLRRDLSPEDATEEKLVTALAVAMWKEIRADHAEAGVLTSMSTDGARGRDLGEPRNALSLGTAIRYTTAAGMATQRAQRAFLAHRKAKATRLVIPMPAAAQCTNEVPAPAPEPRADSASQNRTNEFPTTRRHPDIDPLAALRARIDRLLAGTDQHDPASRDLAAAILAARLPGAPPYRGPIDLALLDRALTPLDFDTRHSAGTQRWLCPRRRTRWPPSAPCPSALAVAT